MESCVDLHSIRLNSCRVAALEDTPCAMDRLYGSIWLLIPEGHGDYSIGRMSTGFRN